MAKKSNAYLENCDLRGRDATLYYNTGTEGSPIWVEHIGITGDLTCNETEDENELPTRNRNRVVKEYTSGDTDIGISGTQVMDSEYYGWQVLYSMRGGGGAAYDMMFLTEPISNVGAVGWRGKMRNFDRTFNAPETGSQTQNFNLKPAACASPNVRPVRIETTDTVTNDTPGTLASAPSTTTTTTGS